MFALRVSSPPPDSSLASIRAYHHIVPFRPPQALGKFPPSFSTALAAFVPHPVVQLGDCRASPEQVLVHGWAMREGHIIGTLRGREAGEAAHHSLTLVNSKLPVLHEQYRCNFLLQSLTEGEPPPTWDNRTNSDSCRVGWLISDELTTISCCSRRREAAAARR